MIVADRKQACHRSRGMSLLEGVIVLAVLAILIAIIFAIGHSGPSPGFRQTNITLQVLEDQMEEYLKHHPEPTAADWQTSLEADKHIQQDLASLPHFRGKIVDAHGNPIQYVPSRTTEQTRRGGYFESAGLDGIMGNKDDLFSNAISSPPQ